MLISIMIWPFSNECDDLRIHFLIDLSYTYIILYILLYMHNIKCIFALSVIIK